MAWNVMSGVTKTAWDIMSGVTKTAWFVLSRVTNLCGMFFLGCQKWHGMFAWDVFSGSHGKVTTSQLYITNESQEVSPFPAGDHKASIYRRA